MNKQKKIFLLLSVLTLVFIFLVKVNFQPNQERVAPEPSRMSPRPLVKEPEKISEGVSKKPSEKIVQSKAKGEDGSLWRVFQNTFGSNLKAEFSPSGRAISIQGEMGAGSKAGPDFRSSDPKKVMDRAKEILSAAQALLSIHADWPLTDGDVQVSPISGHVFFHETYDGIPVSPVGTVKISLGSQGELIALYSDYAPEVKITNQPRLSSEQAKPYALFGLKDPDLILPKVAGGEKIVWVTGSNGRVAYDYTVEGRRIVVDAQSGEILHNRDIRRY